MTQPEISDIDGRPRDFVRIELPEHQPVIDVMPACGPDGSLVWMNAYDMPRGSFFLTVEHARELARALAHQARVTQDYLDGKAGLHDATR